MDAEEALAVAEEIFIERGSKMMPPLTKFELYYQEEITLDPR